MFLYARGRTLSASSLLRIATGAFLLVALSAPLALAAPIESIYKSDDMDGGVFLTGRWTEGYVLNNPDGTGNGAHAGSWDGGTLYSQWELTGPLLTGSTEIADTVSGGNGIKVYARTFDASAATLTLKNAAWWSGSVGDGDYIIDLDSYAQTVVLQYSGGNVVFAHSTESFYGTFQGYPQYSLVGQASGVFTGQGPALPANFPSWVRSGAAGGILNGAWGEVGLVEFQIAPEPATLSLLGVAAAAAIAARRRK